MTQELESMTHTVLREIEGALDTKRVVGEPVKVGDYTILPLISIGFGFGVGSGTGKSDELIKGEGSGGASAGGGGMRPVAVVVIGPEGAKVEPIKGATASLLESLAANIPALRTKPKASAD
jgi:uncharacterized spore protein YtfJ